MISHQLTKTLQFLPKYHFVKPLLYDWVIESFTQSICSKAQIHSVTRPPLCFSEVCNGSALAFRTIFAKKDIGLKCNSLNVNFLSIELLYKISLTFSIMLILRKKQHFFLCDIA